MKSQARTKIGGRKGNPAYRTPSGFKYRKSVQIKKHHKAL